MTEPDSDTASDDAPTGARMVLEPDALYEHEAELAVNCPQCGATVSLQHIVEAGTCSGYLADAESGPESPKDTGCDAKLSLELVWEG